MSLGIGNLMKPVSRRAIAPARSSIVALAIMLLCTSACTSVGPGTGRVVKAGQSETLAGIQVVTLDNQTVRTYAPPATPSFSQTMGNTRPLGQIVGIGDTLQITIWEAPPAVLFAPISAGSASSTSGSAGEIARAVSFPDYLVGTSGRITIPFAGSLDVVGRSPDQLEREITARLSKKAHLPQVAVHISKNASANVSVVGEVKTGVRLQITPKGETILDALAAAGGTSQPVNKITIQISRNGQVFSMPMESVVRDPQQNIILQAGDIITVLYQPYSFTALGAAGRNEEVNFESTGLTLAQALGRVAGLQEGRADPKGVFIFRWEDPSAIPNLTADAKTGPDGKVPVIYRIDLKDPATYFAMQHFPVRNKDVVFIANSFAADFQRFLGLVVSTASPVVTLNNSLSQN